MHIVKCLAGKERESFAGFTAPSIRQLLVSSEDGDKSVAVGAFAWPSPVGLAVLELNGPRTGLVRSIAVAASYRRQGIGQAIFQELERESLRRGIRAVEIRQLTAGEPSPALVGLLRKSAWPAMQPSGIFCESEYSLISQAPWMKHQVFPAHFETFLWTDLSPAEKTGLLDRQREEPWFPEQLNPFAHEERLHRRTSVGLRYRGEVAGWCVTHIAGTDGLTVASLFVKKELQPRGHAIRLLAYAIEHALGSGMTQLFFNIGFGMNGMIHFFHRHMRPYVTAVRTLHVSTKMLQQDHETAGAVLWSA